MPFVFSDEELEYLSARIAERLIPTLIDALKRKAAIKAKALPPNLMDVKEFCMRTGMIDTWVYKRCREGGIPCVKIGKFYRFERAEVEEMIRTGRF